MAIVPASDAYREGSDARRNGMPQDECPYEEGTQQQIDWDNGWEQADWDIESEDEEDDDDE